MGLYLLDSKPCILWISVIGHIYVLGLKGGADLMDWDVVHLSSPSPTCK